MNVPGLWEYMFPYLAKGYFLCYSTRSRYARLVRLNHNVGSPYAGGNIPNDGSLAVGFPFHLDI